MVLYSNPNTNPQRERLEVWCDVPVGAYGLHTQAEARRWWAIALIMYEPDFKETVIYYYQGDKSWCDDISYALVGDKRTMRRVLTEINEPNAYIKHCLDWVKVPK